MAKKGLRYYVWGGSANRARAANQPPTVAGKELIDLLLSAKKGATVELQEYDNDHFTEAVTVKIIDKEQGD